MYKLQVLTRQDHVVAAFEAGHTMREANAFYRAFLQSGLYVGHCLHIKEV